MAIVFQSLFIFMVGAAAVVQGGLNRQISSHYGVAFATLLNNIVFMAGAASLFLWAKYSSLAPELFRPKGNFTFQWWHLAPGLIGVLLVSGIPFSMAKVGATKTFTGIILAQIIVSVLWDQLVEQVDFSAQKIAGVILALVSYFLVMRG